MTSPYSIRMYCVPGAASSLAPASAAGPLRKWVGCEKQQNCQTQERVLETATRRRPHTAPATMPTAKRQKKSASSQPPKSQPPPTAAVAVPVTEGESEFAQLAKQHWLKTSKKATKVKVKNDVLKQDIWDPLERDRFPISSLLALEGLQILER